MIPQSGMTEKGNKYVVCTPLDEEARGYLESIIDAAVDKVRRENHSPDPNFPFWCWGAWETSSHTDPRCAGGCGSRGHWKIYGPRQEEIAG